MKNIDGVKTRIVKSIPNTDRNTRGAYMRFWTDLRKTPKGEYLEIKAPLKTQKLISHFLYYKGRKQRKKVSCAFKDKALYAYWK